jgi:hypothetical protein
MLKLWKLIIITLSFWACNNDIKIAAPWKETIVVYGLLDPAASVNYIRIQKAFLDPDGNAFQFVNENDSIYPKSLTVKLFVRKNGTLIDTLFPQLIKGEDFGIKKDTGLFSTAPNYLYKVDKKIFDSRIITGGTEDYEYELVIKNKLTGYQCSAKTNTTGLLESSAPVDESSTNLSINDKANSYLSIVYREGRNVKTYDLIIRFWYEEALKSDTSIKTLKSFDWNIFKNKPTKSIRGYESQFFQISGSFFYEVLQSNIKPNSNFIRRAKYLDVEYYGAGEDLYTFIQVNKPAIGIIQKKPEYSNISNGLGIFSSRYITSFKKIPVGLDMKNTLRNSAYTKDLNFE